MLFDDKRWKLPEIPAPELPKAKPRVKRKKKALEPWQKLLLDAAKIIKEKGWCRDSFQSHGRYCALGALNKAEGRRPSDEAPSSPARLKAESALMGYINDGDEYRYWSIDMWNDNQSRRSVVIEAMRKAAKK